MKISPSHLREAVNDAVKERARAGDERRLLRLLVRWAESEPVLRSLTNGNIEGRAVREIRLAHLARVYKIRYHA